MALPGRESEQRAGAHRPQLASRALKQRAVHSKRQTRLTISAVRAYRTQAQRIVEVGRMHLSAAVVPRASRQPCDACVATVPHVAERAVPRAILQADGGEAGVQRAALGDANTDAAARVGVRRPSSIE